MTRKNGTTGRTGTGRQDAVRSAQPRRGRRPVGPVLLFAGLAGLCLTVVAPAGASEAPAADRGPGRGHATSAIVDSTRHDGRSVALTFDDGPNPTDTPRLLEVLREHRVKAVFCLWGEHVEQHPEVVRAIVADGHALCNHTMRHDDISAWSPERIRADLRQTNEAIRRAVPGSAPVRWFRAPYGSWGEHAADVAAGMGMQPLGWRLDIADWEPPGTDELVRRLEEGITPGAVVLLHDGGGDRSQTVEAVDRVIPVFKDHGWRFDRPARRG
ncbi:polysaccharide deacetylase family protein [Streptomyces lycii]|uniref:Polysaccharide deacetylase family protein n=1 Tax=Streptomyces lycii TaxID=2654337 RepID=A0ABQ7FGW0_9ACTN|nr:polysaccharide deacetylase family protein [Streptomyces lycii]KAF4408060.1 polysaccharide deacetylase family protein [Streptomyces lycii]